MPEQNNYEGSDTFPKLAKIGWVKNVIQELFHQRKLIIADPLHSFRQSVIRLLFSKCP
jgi:hypothetical protein